MSSIYRLGAVMCLAGVLMSAQEPAAPTLPKDEYVTRDEVVKPGLAPGMKATDLGPGSAGRTFQILFTKGDEVASGLLEFAEKNHLKNSHFTGIGAFDQAVLGWYDPAKKAQKKNKFNEEMEVAAFTGNVTLNKDGKPVVHAHCVVALSDGSAKAGHFVSGHVSLVMQIYLVDSDPR
jgi:uncharacterized protein